MARTADYGPRALAIVALVGVGVVAARSYEPLYSYAWSHPSVMLLGQFVLLAVGAYTRPWTLAGFWVFSGVTAYALLFRASDALGGGLAAGVAAVVASALALALFARVDVGQSRQSQ